MGLQKWREIARLKNVDSAQFETFSSLERITYTTLFYSSSSPLPLWIASKTYIETYSDPTLVPNRCWYQKLDHFLGLKDIQKIETKITNRNLPYQLLNFTAAFYSVSLLNNLQIASKKHVQAYFDLTLVPNGSRHQNLDLFLGLIDSNISKLKQQIETYPTNY